MGTLKADLLAAELELIETHISWVFLGPADVFKVKRPVDLGFLDFSTPAARRRACEAEVRLNRRLAPDVYLGVVPITLDEGGAHAIDGDGETVDWAVHMRRLRFERRADALLETDSLAPEDIDRLAEHIARFHAAARCDAETSQYGTVDAIGQNVRENFAQTQDSIAEYLTPEQAREVQSWQLGILHDEQRFSARIADGRVRDGHGDLRLEHVYFERDGAIAIIDCIEFNERFRYADVCADIAFLSMDLAWHGRVDLAERLLAQYARTANDYDLYSVVDFYESYRAFVRGKVAALLSADHEASAIARERAHREARRYFMLALAFERPPLAPPKVVAVAGVIASGKSRNAITAGEVLAAPVISSDRIRKHMMDRQPEETMKSEAWTGAYSERATKSVYDELFRLAEVILDSGRPVVIDASFRTVALRAAVKSLAERRGIPFVLVECTAPRDLLIRRLTARERRGAHESDARADLLDEFETRFEPITELPASEHARLDTSRPKEENRARLESILGV